MGYHSKLAGENVMLKRFGMHTAVLFSVAYVVFAAAVDLQAACTDGCYLYQWYNSGAPMTDFKTSVPVCIEFAHTSGSSTSCPSLQDLSGSCGFLIQVTRWPTDVNRCCVKPSVRGQNIANTATMGVQLQ